MSVLLKCKLISGSCTELLQFSVGHSNVKAKKINLRKYACQPFRLVIYFQKFLLFGSTSGSPRKRAVYVMEGQAVGRAVSLNAINCFG